MIFLYFLLFEKILATGPPRGIPSWGTKRTRTARYEVSQDENKSCEICRPKCPHWKNLSQPKRNVESMKWYLRKQTKEEKVAYRQNKNKMKREWYANLPKDKKVKYLKKSSDYKREQLSNMSIEQRKAKTLKATLRRKQRLDRLTPEQRREWHRKNNGYNRKSKAKEDTMNLTM